MNKQPRRTHAWVPVKPWGAFTRKDAAVCVLCGETK